jgi:hypothetical protein
MFRVSINGQTIRAQADPGAVISLIAEDTLERILENTHKEWYETFVTTEAENLNISCTETGSRLEITGLVMLPIKFRLIEKRLAVYIVKGKGVVDGITLGQAFIMTHNVKMERTNGTLAETTTRKARYADPKNDGRREQNAQPTAPY